MVNKRERNVSIEVVSRHQHVSERTRAFAVERAQRITRFHDRISGIQVLLDEEHGMFLSEVIVQVPHQGNLVAKGEESGYRASMDVAFDKLSRQLKKLKEKSRNHKHDGVGELQTSSVDLDHEDLDGQID